MTTIGIIGCGAVSQGLLKASESGVLTLPISGITSRTKEKAQKFLSTLKKPPEYYTREKLITKSDLIVEAAGGDVVPELARETFESGKDLMAISIGALVDYPDIIELAKKHGCKLYAPSGAIAGLDGIKSASIGRLDKVVMITRKPLMALEGSPYLVERGVSVLGFTEEKEIFHGTAREACRGFPANVNVSAAVSLAGIGPDKTQIRIIAVPGLERNCHDIEVEGEFGRLAIHIENIPTENPRTGKLTVMSIIRTLQGIIDPLQVGT
jgi:aspartate dehydrogenase